MEEYLTVEGEIMQAGLKGDFPNICVVFKKLNLAQQRRLVTMLFCRPGQWTRKQTPGELWSLWLLLNIVSVKQV